MALGFHDACSLDTEIERLKVSLATDTRIIEEPTDSKKVKEISIPLSVFRRMIAERRLAELEIARLKY